MSYFRSWETSDRIELSENSKAALETISDKERILQVARFVENREDGWSVPLVGTPIARFNLRFYSGRTFLGHLGIGTNFLEAQGCDGFVSRNLPPKERQLLVSLIGRP